MFAYLPALLDVEHAGRSYAAYGGIYIVAAVLWLWIAEGVRPDRWDLLGAAVCIVGACIILMGPRAPARAVEGPAGPVASQVDPDA